MTETSMISQINDAVGAHGLWKMRLRAAIRTGTSDITPQAASCDDGCAFGKWLYGSQIIPSQKAGMPYQVIKRLHAEFHRSAGQVMSHALAGRTEQAETIMQEEFAERSEKLVRALAKWKRELC